MANKQEKVQLYCRDCFDVMSELPDKSVDMVLADPPFGTTSCKWDTVIPFEPLWVQYKRLVKDNGAIVLFGNEPFSSQLRCSNLDMYKYDWIWEKSNAGNYLNKHCMPGKITENICVFSKGKCSPNAKLKMKYNPQLEKGEPYKVLNKNARKSCAVVSGQTPQPDIINEGTRLPNNLLYFEHDWKRYHPTQKPVSLLKYLVETYTNPRDLVLDNCMGSGSTGVACVETGRKFIGIEKEKEYFEIAKKRINDVKQQ